MNVNLTPEDFDAIRFAENQLTIAMESFDDDTAHEVSVHAEHLRQIQAKYLAINHARTRKKKLFELAKMKFPDASHLYLNKVVKELLAQEKQSKK